MTDVQSFAESEKLEKSNITVIIVQIGVEKTGQCKNKSTWRGRKITMQDKAGQIKVSMAWRDTSKSFKEGKSYKLYDVSWKPYGDSQQLQLSTVTKIEPIVVRQVMEEKPKEEKPKIEQACSSDEFLKQKQKEIESNKSEFEKKIQSLKEKYPEFVTKKKEHLEKLLILDSLINESLEGQNKIPPNPQKIGLYMKILNGVDE